MDDLEQIYGVTTIKPRLACRLEGGEGDSGEGDSGHGDWPEFYSPEQVAVIISSGAN